MTGKTTIAAAIVSFALLTGGCGRGVTSVEFASSRLVPHTCFDMTGPPDDASTKVDVIECDEPHDFEAFYGADVQAGVDLLQRCKAKVADYVADLWALPTGVRVQALAPLEESMFKRFVCALGRDGGKLRGSLYWDPATLTKDQAQVVEATGRLDIIEVSDSEDVDTLAKLHGATDDLWFAIDAELQGLAVAGWSAAAKPFAETALPHLQKLKDLVAAVNGAATLEAGKAAYDKACAELATIINDLIALRRAVGLVTVPPPAFQRFL